MSFLMLGCSLSQIGGAGKDEECHEIGAGLNGSTEALTPRIGDEKSAGGL